MRRILDLLFPPRDDEEILRAVPETNLLELLSPHGVEKTRPETLALLPFRDRRVRAAVHEAKYHGNRRAFDLLAAVLAEYLLDAERDLTNARLVPVPLGAKRRKERGFNQVEEVARRASERLSVPLAVDALERTRDTESQIALPRGKRKENLRGAFSAAQDLEPSHLEIVVDDVVTTGATMQAAVDALTRAGARDILPIALAH